MITNNIVDLIGNTPLIKLKYPSEITNCEIYGKAEFLNPGGSIKDRTALGIILDAEKNKLIEPNGICVEGTFGNTGIGLTLVNNARGYKTVIVMPNITAQSKRDILDNYKVTQEIISLADKDVIFLHCLPAHRDEEVEASVIDGPHSYVWDEAENRLHAQKGIIEWCLKSI